MSDEVRSCPGCGADAPPAANWCEACGTDLDPTPAVSPDPAPVAEEPASAPLYEPSGPCVSCGAAELEITVDGWCQQCGSKQPDPTDHVIDDRGWFAVVSDRGRRHRTNEDAGAIGSNEDTLALVVCDGVSSTDDAHHASQAAATAALAELLHPGTDDLTVRPEAGLRLAAATAAGQDAAVAATNGATLSPASCTFVAALVDRAEDETLRITVGWLGDSRAYWCVDGHASLLTRDHTWAIEQQTIGTLTDEEIAADSRAHSITRWIGADSTDVTPEVVELTVTTSGLLVLCSDGLWNYADDPVAFGALVNEADTDYPDAIELAERLVTHANDKGGHDNITVAVARLANSFTEAESSDPSPDPSTSNQPSNP